MQRPFIHPYAYSILILLSTTITVVVFISFLLLFHYCYCYKTVTTDKLLRASYSSWVNLVMRKSLYCHPLQGEVHL